MIKKVGSGSERSGKSDPVLSVLESRIRQCAFWKVVSAFCMARSILESRIRPWAFWKVGLIRAIWKSCPYSVKWCQEPQQHGYKFRDQRLLLKMHLLINSLYIHYSLDALLTYWSILYTEQGMPRHMETVKFLNSFRISVVMSQKLHKSPFIFVAWNYVMMGMNRFKSLHGF